MESFEFVSVHSPLDIIPGLLIFEFGFFDTSIFGYDPLEGRGVIATDTIEINP
jgi:hypothetical protein